jgi:MSHA pilin protein MshD
MNTGQMLITIGAIFILSVVILRVNTNLLITDNVIDKSKVNLLAVSIATSCIEEATSKAFDENSVSSAITDSTGFSSTLGKETGEVYPLFDDFDDYNSFQTNPKLDSIEFETGKFLVFQTFCKVNYVPFANPNSTTSNKTWSKRMTVLVTSDAMLDEELGVQDTITMSTIYSYWFFR